MERTAYIPDSAIRSIMKKELASLAEEAVKAGKELPDPYQENKKYCFEDLKVGWQVQLEYAEQGSTKVGQLPMRSVVVHELHQNWWKHVGTKIEAHLFRYLCFVLDLFTVNCSLHLIIIYSNYTVYSVSIVTQESSRVSI